jgi:hypothetical protein
MCIMFTKIIDKAVLSWAVAIVTLFSQICHLVEAPVASAIVKEQGRYM